MKNVDKNQGFGQLTTAFKQCDHQEKKAIARGDRLSAEGYSAKKDGLLKRMLLHVTSSDLRAARERRIKVEQSKTNGQNLQKNPGNDYPAESRADDTVTLRYPPNVHIALRGTSLIHPVIC